jgi:hypothetical protein
MLYHYLKCTAEPGERPVKKKERGSVVKDA